MGVLGHTILDSGLLKDACVDKGRGEDDITGHRGSQKMNVAGLLLKGIG